MATTNFTHQISNWEAALLEFARQLTKKEADAQQLQRETIERALLQRNKYREGTSLKSWLFSIMRTICASGYCKGAKQKRLSTPRDRKNYTSAKKVTKHVDYAFAVSELQDFVNALEPSVKEPFMLHYYGYKTQEIAHLLKITPFLVKERIGAVQRQLKAAQSKKCKDVLLITA